MLTAVARLVAESRSLRDVVTGLATILRDVVPFERLHILRFDRAESFELYTAEPTGALDVTARRITGAGPISDDTVGDARSRVVCTVRQGPFVRGALWLTSSAADVFTATHQELADSVADLVALAFQVATIHERESARRLERRVPAMTAKGRVKRKKAYLRHNLGAKSSSAKRNLRRGGYISETQEHQIKAMLPYGT